MVKNFTFLKANSKDPDQSVQIRKLIHVFIVCKTNSHTI